MKKTLSIAENTLKIIARERSLYFISVFPLFMALMAVLIKPLVLGEFEKILNDFANSTLLLTGILISVITGTSVIQTELKQKTIYLILSKPVRKECYVFGKFLGMYAGVFILQTAIAVLFIAVFLTTGFSLRNGFFINFVFVQFQLLIVCSLSVFFSSFATPVTSAVFTFLTVVSGMFLSSALNFSDIGEKLNPVVASAVSILGYILPALSQIDINVLAYSNIALGSDFIIFSAAYSLCYVTACLFLSVLIFDGKEFS